MNNGIGDVLHPVPSNLPQYDEVMSSRTKICDIHGHEANVQLISNAIDGTEYALITNSIIHGRTTGQGGGWVDVKVNPSGALTVEATVTSTTLPTGAATSANQTNGNQITQVSSCALPTGAATAAKQLADNHQVTANAGTNLNTSLLAKDSTITGGTQKTQITDSSGNAVQIGAREQTPTGNVMQVQIGPGDLISNLPVIQAYDHHQIHEGETWRWSVFISSLNSGSSKDIQLVVPNISIPAGQNRVQVSPHYRFQIVSDSYTNFYLYEAPTISVNGSSRSPINQERNGSYTPKLLVYEDPTVTGVGTQIFQGVTFTSKSSGGAVDSAQDEFVLKNNTTYLLRVTSGTQGAKVLIRMIWYEDLGV